ncbi:glycine-rich domain-containing protein [Mycobacteroides immunogenum]|uniref:glycine-rich domain-containing protein n=1 Tax=Mycobacteroides immunogenum TaxID=83262 RepID=UPI000698D019|nr:hypothetical protein [Mycobacteroides immunogenum]ANO03594.1 hypothetical protein BAB75_09520 [Mycobacteroides immunogenum]MCV7306646.1 hypothetical protein [Mycobacteroides immunogenum]ORV77637.1 hypothetical protein AWC10_15910 [Mycobacteroides immunogenum]
MTTPGGPGSINPNARFGITGDNSHGDTVADLQQRLQAAIEGRLKSDIKASQGWKGASDAAFGGLMLRGTPGQPVSISLAIIASLAARLLGINPQSWLISADPHENIERILAELKKVPILDDLIELITGVEDGDESDLGTWALGIRNALLGIDLSNPGSILTAIGKAAVQFFNGLIPVSWIADVIDDLTRGAGQFLTGDSIAGNPFLSWDPNTAGSASGLSGKMAGNGTWQSVRGEIFDVAPKQVVKFPAATKWSGVTATPGTNPIKVGFATWDAAGNALPDVITGQVQPSSASASWQAIATTGWVVPNGVAQAAPIITLDAGAQSGSVWFSDISSYKSNKMAPNIVESLIEGGQDLAEDIQNTWDSFWNGVFGGSATGKTPTDVHTATSKLKQTADDAQAQAIYAADLINTPRRTPRWLSTGTHDDVSFPIINAQSTFTPPLGKLVLIPITSEISRTYRAVKVGLTANTMTALYIGLYRIDHGGYIVLDTDFGNQKVNVSASKVQTFPAPGTGFVSDRGETTFIGVLQVGGTAAPMLTTPAMPSALEAVQAVPLFFTQDGGASLSALPATVGASVELTPVWGALGEQLLTSAWTDYTLTDAIQDHTISSDSRFLDLVGCSPGGGGGGGDGGFNKPGEGGSPGQWVGRRIERGVDIPWSVTTLSIRPGGPGLGASSRESDGGAGGGFNYRQAGIRPLIGYTPLGADVQSWLLESQFGDGGRLAYGGFFNRDPVGYGPGNFAFGGRLFIGGANAAMDQLGIGPGGGGGGGHGGTFGNAAGGRNGGPGFVAIRAV